MVKKLDRYAKCFQKSGLIKEILKKKNVFFDKKKNEESLEKYNEIWDKVNNSMKRECDSELIYNRKYIKT